MTWRLNNNIYCEVITFNTIKLINTFILHRVTNFLYVCGGNASDVLLANFKYKIQY